MSDKAAQQWPGFTNEAHPEIFTSIPPQPEQLKKGQLTEDQINKFFKEV